MEDLKVELEELKEESDQGTQIETPSIGQPLHRAWLWVGAAAVVVAIAVTGWIFHRAPNKPQAAVEVVPLTSYPGFEGFPSFSPDGNQVAFSWDGEKQNNFDIYIKQIGSPNYVRLTTDPADDISPAFSPDGRSIGFVRVSKERSVFITIPSIGGPERPVAEGLPAPIPFAVGHLFDWIPNGKWVVTEGLSLLSTESGEMRSLTSPPTKSESDISPAVSPDGRTVAFIRGSTVGASRIYLLDLTEDLKPTGEPRALTSLKRQDFSPVWTPNGREIIFASSLNAASLWRVLASGSGEPEPLPFTGTSVYCPAISRSGNRLAYQQSQSGTNIWRLILSAPAVARGAAVRLIASTRYEGSAEYSPDGKRIAFESRSSGVQGIWVSDADGSHAVELFSHAGALCGTPRWSPDGQRIAFDYNAEGNLDVYVIRASGGKLTRLTTHSANDTPGSWSRDGKWVYFASNRTGRYEIWKVPSGGGEAIQITRNGGETAFESPDGKSLYYTKEFFGPSALWKMPVNGSEESQVLPSVSWRGFTLTYDGIYFIPESGADGKFSIQFLSFAAGKVKTVALMSGRPSAGLSVAPGGLSLLFSLSQGDSDLMLVENFR